MEITASKVNELRQKTGAGMMDCKKALVESNGDFEKAIEILRKKGAAVASKRAEKSANEGMVLTKVSDDGKSGVMVEVNCETDFVARSEDFISFANLVLQTAASNRSKNVDELLKSNANLSEKLSDVMGKVGEKIEISRLTFEETNDGVVIDYIHPGSKLGVLVMFDTLTDHHEDFAAIGKDTAMQVAAMKPLCVNRDEVPKDIIEKETDIYKELARKEGKPENILEKIAQGKLNKFYQENCLSEQIYIKDNTKTINDLLKEFNLKFKTNVKLSRFKRFHLSDEKK
ncbi:MAG: elongation factor Ts [Ignavibacteriaceae bacterium]|nr:elongation factor Ts [Ignavibacteriaceae bacterium]